MFVLVILLYEYDHAYFSTPRETMYICVISYKCALVHVYISCFMLDNTDVLGYYSV